METYEELLERREALATQRAKNDRQGNYAEHEALTQQIRDLWDQMADAPLGDPNMRKTWLHTGGRA